MLFDEFISVLDEKGLIDSSIACDLINGYDYEEVLEREGLAMCVECERWEYERHLTETNRGLVCENCLEESYVSCEYCGEIYHIDDVHLWNDDYYCRDCYNEYCNPDILSYHEYGYNNYKPIGESLLHFGLELEYNGESITQPIKDLDYNNIFHFESDCTAEAFEMISQPLSMDEWLKYSETMKDIFKTMKEYTEVDDGVGLHVHISRTAFKDKKALDSFIAFVNAFKEPFEQIAKRKTHFARFDRFRTTLKDIEIQGYNTDKYTAVNVLHKNSIEVRIFQSTHNMEYILDVLTVLKRLIDKCNEHKTYIDFKFLILDTMFNGNIGIAEDTEAYI